MILFGSTDRQKSPKLPSKIAAGNPRYEEEEWLETYSFRSSILSPPCSKAIDPKSYHRNPISNGKSDLEKW
jgi:hypothetical protein